MSDKLKSDSPEGSDVPAEAAEPSEKPKAYTFTVPRMPRPILLQRPPRSKKPSRRRRALGLLVLLLLVGLASAFGGIWLEHHYNLTYLANPLNTNLSNQRRIVTSQSQLISQIAKSVGPSVVSVNVAITAGSSPISDLGILGADPSRPVQEQAAGTGIIISDKGIVVTNRHVVPAGTTKVSVTLSDGTELKDVTVLGRTNNSDSLDIAFLKIPDAQGHKLRAAKFGDSTQVQVGDNVVAIGNALGQFQNTVTSGIISGFGRSVRAGDSSGNGSSSENLDNLFQTDAAINEGNSGGPLVNISGQVIGINTALAGGAQNIGFAIPINDVQGLIDQVLKTGKFARSYLGVRYIPLTADTASQFELKVNQGAFIPPAIDPASPSVLPDGPAGHAGLHEKDIITHIDGTKIDQSHSLTTLLSRHQPGDRVNLTILRDGKVQQLSVTLGALPSAP